MKKIHLFAAALLCAVTSPFARGESLTETITLTFSESDFSITTDSDCLTHIESHDPLFVFSDATTDPAIPIFTKNYVAPAGYHYQSITPGFTKRLIATNVTLAQVPKYYSREELNSVLQLPHSAPQISYPAQIFPETACRYAGETEWDDATVIHFIYSPFVYDAGAKCLYFIDELTAEISTETQPASSRRKSKQATLGMAPLSGSDIKSSEYRRVIPVEEEFPEYASVDYLIVTNENLKSSFKSLLDWKRTKGLRTDIVTTEFIDSKYPGNDLVYKIKQYLYQAYQNSKVKYVMLGGDDTVVPVRFTRNSHTTSPDSIKYNHPADYYYACFRSDLTWDRNKNGVYGDLNDSINFTPSIYVTRLPVRTPEHIKAYTTKLLSYERDGKWNKSMLMGGKSISRDPSENPSDAYYIGEKLYNECIAPLWDGTVEKFYDTGTTFEGGASYDFTTPNITAQLAKGYGFADFITHGSQTGWETEEATSATIYSTAYAASQKNPASTIIVTAACSTNVFDSHFAGFDDDPCLSESFIRNADNGVIAYLGSSRETGFYPSRINGHNMLIRSDFVNTVSLRFYNYLFGDSFSNKSFGALVSHIKESFVPFFYDNPGASNNSRDYIMNLNPIGDPEMPLYTEKPTKLSGIQASIKSDTLRINTGNQNCTIAVTGSGSNSDFFHVFKNMNAATVSNLPKQFNICITKQNHIPAIYIASKELLNKWFIRERIFPYDAVELDTTIIKRADHVYKILDYTTSPSGDIATFNTQIEEESGDASLVFTSLMGNKEKEVEIPAGETSVTTSVASLPSGIHLVTLMVNGRVCDSCRLVKK